MFARHQALRLASAVAVLLWAETSIAMAAVIDGTPEPDNLEGTASADTISAVGGADVVHGRGGPDQVDGGEGHDLLFGDAGNDTLRGGAGPDELRGSYGRDTLILLDGDLGFGGGQGDSLRFSGGGSRGHGGYGEDFLFSEGPGTHLLYGEGGSDQLETSGEASLGTKLFGGPGNDLFNDNDSSLQGGMFGGDGSDGFIAMTAGTVAFGGAGDDSFFSTEHGAAPAQNEIHCGPGDDTIIQADTSDVIDDDCEQVEILIVGDDGDNTIIGTNYPDRVEAGAGEDTIHGLGSRDEIFGNAGDDTAFGGAGNDVMQMYGFADADKVDCGPGDADIANVTPDDTVLNCEIVNVLDL
jgi:Ca2+-binding RTX toxin-like protein